MTTLRLYSHSRLETFRQCLRKGYYSYIRQWAGEGSGLDVTFGSSFHAAMDVIWANHKAQGDERKAATAQAYQAFIAEWVKAGFTHPDEMSPDDFDALGAKSPPIAHEMLHNYWDAREHIFLDPSFELLDIERPFAVPLDPNDPTLFYVGKLDKIFRYRGRVIVGEHKTSGQYKIGGVFRQSYIDSFSPSAQIDGYLFALHMLIAEGAFGHEAKSGGVWVDAALAHKKIHDGFKLIPIERKMEHLDEWLWEVMTLVDTIEGNKAALAGASPEQPYLAAFSKNTSACGNYSGCRYRDLCRSYANPERERETPLGFVVKAESMFERLKLEKLGFTPEQVSVDSADSTV